MHYSSANINIDQEIINEITLETRNANAKESWGRSGICGGSSIIGIVSKGLDSPRLQERSDEIWRME